MWLWILHNWRDQWLGNFTWWQAAAAFLQTVATVLLLFVTARYVRLTRRLVKASVHQALFDKRLKVFYDTMGFLATSPWEVPAAMQLLRDTKPAEFLFEQDVVDFINRIYKKATELHARNQALKAVDVNDRIAMEQAIEQTTLLENWLAETSFIEAKRIFHPYLKFNAGDWGDSSPRKFEKMWWKRSKP